MARWKRSRVAVVVAAALVAGAMVVSAIVVGGDVELRTTGDPAASATPGSTAADAPSDDRTLDSGAADPSLPAASSAGARAAVAPDEPMDAPRAWTRQDPSVAAPPAEVVAEAAPGAGEDTPLRVVSVVNTGGEPEVLVEEVRGADAAERAVGEAQDTENVLAVAVDTRVSLDTVPVAAPALPNGLLPGADSLRTNQWALNRLRADKVWSDYSSGTGTVVAVVDTGVDGSHPDLSGRLTAAGVDYVTGTGDGRTDPHGHGTHVAGVVAAVRGNGIGVAGLAPLAQVMPIRVLDEAGSGWSSNIAKGIVYAADNGADVVNLSLGGPTEDSATKVAVNYAMSKGIIVVAAAGNSRATGNATNYPAALPGVIAVASTEQSDASSAFSNTGSYIDIAAPGGRILSTVPGGYAYMSGTSMATPYVAATAALVADITGGTVTTEQFERNLTRTATDLGPAGWDPEFGYGLADPYQSLCAFSTCAATATPTPTPSPTQTPTSAPAPPPAPAPTQTIAPTASASPTSAPTSPGAPSPTASTQPSPAPRATTSPEPAPTPRSKPIPSFTSGGGTARPDQLVPIRMRVTDAATGKPVAGHRVIVRGWRNGAIALRRVVTTDANGNAATQLRLRATTRFDLRTPATDTTRAATSPTSIRWRVR
jgi:serine protease